MQRRVWKSHLLDLPGLDWWAIEAGLLLPAGAAASADLWLQT